MLRHKLFRNIIADVLNEETKFGAKTRDGLTNSGARYRVPTAEFQHVAVWFILHGPLLNCIKICRMWPGSGSGALLPFGPNGVIEITDYAEQRYWADNGLSDSQRIAPHFMQSVHSSLLSQNPAIFPVPCQNNATQVTILFLLRPTVILSFHLSWFPPSGSSL